jgi:alcohol dehydrogenase (quinone), cytochrome c subunit
MAKVSDCIACHSVPNAAPYSGSLVEMDSPMETSYSTNIPSGSDTGVGKYTSAQFDQAIRHGVAADGHRLYPAMPYASYEKF